MRLGSLGELRPEQRPSDVEPARRTQPQTPAQPPEPALHGPAAPPVLPTLQHLLPLLNSDRDRMLVKSSMSYDLQWSLGPVWCGSESNWAKPLTDCKNSGCVKDKGHNAKPVVDWAIGKKNLSHWQRVGKNHHLPLSSGLLKHTKGITLTWPYLILYSLCAKFASLLAQNGKKRLLLFRPTNEFPNLKSVRKGHNIMQLVSDYNCKERRMEWTSAVHWVHPPSLVASLGASPSSWVDPTPIPTSSTHHLISELYLLCFMSHTCVSSILQCSALSFKLHIFCAIDHFKFILFIIHTFLPQPSSTQLPFTWMCNVQKSSSAEQKIAFKY